MKLALVLALYASPALACGGQPCEPPPPPPPVVTHIPDSDPWVVTPTPEWMPCCQIDGQTLFHAPFYLVILKGQRAADAQTKAYCTALPLQSIPECVGWRAGE